MVPAWPHIAVPSGPSALSRDGLVWPVVGEWPQPLLCAFSSPHLHPGPEPGELGAWPGTDATFGGQLLWYQLGKGQALAFGLTSWLFPRPEEHAMPGRRCPLVPGLFGTVTSGTLLSSTRPSSLTLPPCPPPHIPWHPDPHDYALVRGPGRHTACALAGLSIPG